MKNATQTISKERPLKKRRAKSKPIAKFFGKHLELTYKQQIHELKNSGDVYKMAKTYLSAVKYEILAKYEVSGVIEKPDMVGAIFGQSEGLLGEDMDLKELQQSGKIGRIEVTVNKGKGTTAGEITVPSSLDQVKTSILAATIETVEKVGPFDAKVKVLKISDTRKEKRDVITDRAKELLKHMQKFEGVESSEMADEIKTDLRTEKIVELNGMPAGPEAADSPEIIVVEGRADVLKLLSYGIKNAVAMNGANISPELVALCKTKTVTVLVDGDRGGELNVKKLSSMTKIDFIAKAPDGKEVEELTQKEILQSLKRRQTTVEAFNGESFGAGRERFAPAQAAYAPQQPYGQQNGFAPRPRYNDRNPGFNGGNNRSFGGRDRNFNAPRFGDRNQSFGNDRGYGNDRSYGGRDRNFGGDRGFRPRFEDRGDRNFPRPQNGFNNYGPAQGEGTQMHAPTQMQHVAVHTMTPSAPQARAPTQFAQAQGPQGMPKEVSALQKDFDKMKGKLKARLLDEKGKKIKDVDVKDLLTTLEKNKKKVGTIMFDGIITKRLVEAAEQKEIATIIGAKKGSVSSVKVKIYTL